MAGSERSGGAGRPGRHALLEATITVVARDGLRQTTYRSVAREAGVAPSLISHHFGSVDALIAAALDHISAGPLVDPAALSGPQGFLSEVPRLAEQLAQRHVFQWEMTLEASRRAALRAQVGELHGARVAATLGGLAEQGVTDDDLAVLVLALVDGLVLRQLSVGSREESERVLAVLRRLLACAGGDGDGDGAEDVPAAVAADRSAHQTAVVRPGDGGP
jgi:AcrR family transcriptional regulator